MVVLFFNRWEQFRNPDCFATGAWCSQGWSFSDELLKPQTSKMWIVGWIKKIG